MAGHHLSPPSKKRVPTIRLINIPPQRSAQRSPPINNRRARRENRLATGCSPSLSLPRGARAGDRPTDRPAASHGQARARQVPRRGGVLPAGGSGRRQVPVHDGESAAAVGLHPQGVRDRVPAAAADGGRRRDGEPGARHRGLLPLPHHGRHVRHHRRHRRPHPRTGTMVYGCIAALVFSGFIIYDTDNLIRVYSYDEYVAAAIELYLDIINLFQAILAVLEGVD
uniref:Bax inhibitor-1 family protein n=1 Tax=Zea mays TaxID=4577 RepID=A0A804M5H4_MAIZE